MTHKRPRGLWKAHNVAKDSAHLQPPDLYDSDTDDDAETRSSQSSSKRQRSAYGQGNGQGEEKACVEMAPPPPPVKVSCDLDDWDNLKELFAQAAEQYESEGTLSLSAWQHGLTVPQTMVSPNPCHFCELLSANVIVSCVTTQTRLCYSRSYQNDPTNRPTL